jgi:hypothetical protein
MVMQAAIHGQPGVAEQALREIGTLHQAVLELQEEALNFRAAFRD